MQENWAEIKNQNPTDVLDVAAALHVYNGKTQIIMSCIQHLYISSWDNYCFKLGPRTFSIINPVLKLILKLYYFSYDG
jgi:hypothetical protein